MVSEKSISTFIQAYFNYDIVNLCIYLFFSHLAVIGWKRQHCGVLFCEINSFLGYLKSIMKYEEKKNDTCRPMLYKVRDPQKARFFCLFFYVFNPVGKIATLPAVSCASTLFVLNVIRQRNETHRPLSGAWNHTDSDHRANTGFSTAFNIHIITLNL